MNIRLAAELAQCLLHCLQTRRQQPGMMWRAGSTAEGE